jgi:histidinol-phosphate aminotransferase
MKRNKPSFPREDFVPLELYRPDKSPVELNLSDNTNQWGAHPGALAAVREALDLHLARYPHAYSDDLRQAAAERLGVGPGNVCTGAGSDDILDSAFRVAGPPGGSVAFPAPTFAMVETFARLNGREPRPLPWSEALANPERLLHGDPTVVYVCRPNNPSGSLLPRSWVDHLLDAAGPEGPLVVVDEAYAEFMGEGESLVDEAARRGRLLVARTLSKAFALAGFRVGLGIGSPEVVREIEKSRGPFKVSALGELAAATVLRDEEGWVERTAQEAVESRDRLIRALRARGLSPLDSRANFVFLQVGPGCALRYASRLRERGIAVRPFPSCGEFGDGLRITVGPWPMMERLLEALDGVLASESVAPENVVVEMEIDGRETTP